jgi:hypothetical protein
MFTELTVNDLILLEELRIERLRSFFTESLFQCLIYIDHQHRLVIHCPEPLLVDALATDLEELCDYTWLILGLKMIVVFFIQEEVCCINYSSPDRDMPILS